MAESIDIVALVNNNPLTKLSSDYGSKIIQKIKSRFTDIDQQLFVANFYCYLNYNQKTDFVINLDRIWKWLGYSRVDHCKTVLIKNFKENVDYKIEKAAPEDAEAAPNISIEGKNLGGAGLNREYITLTINCFKKLCLKSRTEKADQIHDYYVQLEELMNELVSEQTDELQVKLQTSTKQLEISSKQLQNKDKENQTIINQTLIKTFKNKQVVYLIKVGQKIYKFGHTKDIEQRFKDHTREFGNDITIILIHETIYNREFEMMIKEDQVIKEHIIEKKYKNNQTELIELTDDFTFYHLIKRFDHLKETVNAELIPKLIEENRLLKLTQVTINSSSEMVLKLTDENTKMKQTIYELSEQIQTENDNEVGNCIYIMHNQVAEDLHKIGIIEYSDDIIKDRSFIHFVKTDNSRLIKNMLNIFLRPCINSDNLTYTIPYKELKQIFDFCVAMYDTYTINKNLLSISNFVSRYNTYKLKLQSRERHSIAPEIYKSFIDEHLIYNSNYKIPMVVLCEEFFNWYVKNYDPDKSKSTIKIKNDWSTVFRNEFVNNLEKCTNIKQQNINIVTENLYFHGYTGFIGFSTVDFERRLNEDKRYYKEEIYDEYIKKYITVTDNERHKVSRKELLTDFKEYTIKENIHNKKMFSKVFSSKFITEFMTHLERVTGLKYDAHRTKKEDKGCFVGMTHEKFECIVNTSSKDEVKDNNQYKREKREERKAAMEVVSEETEAEQEVESE